MPLLRMLIAAAALVLLVDVAAHAQETGAIVVDADHPAWLTRHQAGRFFLAGAGDPEGFLFRGERLPDGTRSGDQLELIERLAEHGVNGLYLIAVRSHGGDGGADENPFRNPSDPASGLNPDILEQWDSWFTEMDRAGITVYFFLFDDSVELYDRDSLSTPEREIISGLVNRFKKHRNLIWCVAEEAEEAMSPRKIKQIAAEIRSADDQRHPVALHLNHGLDFSTYADDPNIDQFAVQYNLVSAQEMNAGMVDAFRGADGRFGLNMSESAGHYLDPDTGVGDRRTARLKSWAAAMGGAYVMVIGTTLTDTPDDVLADLGRLADFFEQTRFEQTVPRNDLARGSTDYVLAGDDGPYILYSDSASTPLALSNISAGEYLLTWFDPESGARIHRSQIVTVGAASFEKPPHFGPEVALYLARTSRTQVDPHTCSQSGAEPRTYFPDPDDLGGWRTCFDEAAMLRTAGIERSMLDRAFELVKKTSKNGGLLVLRNGWLVYEEYFGLADRDAIPNLGSVGKSFTSLAVGILMAERPDLFPAGLDQRIFTPDYFPAAAFPLTDPAKEEIRLGQLLAFTAGIRGNNPVHVYGEEQILGLAGPDGWRACEDSVALGLKEVRQAGELYSTQELWCVPGRGYSYATSSAHLASIMLRHVAGMELERFIEDRLARPLGWGRWDYAYQHANLEHTPGGGGIAVRATDILRAGYLMLRGGRWEEREIIPAEYVRHASWMSPYNPHYPYSLQFSVNSEGTIPDVPRDAFWKVGSGEHVLYVVPSLDLVVWKLGGRDGQYRPENTGAELREEQKQRAASREGWTLTVDPVPARHEVLRMVVDAVVR